MMKEIITLLVVCALLFSSCAKTNQKGSDETQMIQTDSLPADFIVFYKRFHQDSMYQFSHITFPLSGTLKDTSGQDSAVTWTQESWTFHHAVTPDDLWAVDFTVPLEGIVIEFIHTRQGGYWMERRFAKMDTTWNLIYYKGLQSLESTVENVDSLIESGELEID